MSAVLRLVLTYFTATPLLRGLSITGLLCILVGTSANLVLPESLFIAASRGPAVGVGTWFMLGLPFFGLLLLIAATISMPSVVERLALSRSVRVLPGGHLRILVSMVLAAGMLSLIVAIGSVAAFIEFRIEPSPATVFYRTLIMAFIDFGLIYAAIWLVTKTSGVWRLAGILWIVVSIGIPLRYIGGMPQLSALEGLGLLSWVFFGALVVSGGRILSACRRAFVDARQFGRSLAPAISYRPGNELDLMLGMNQRWIVAFGQIIPIAVMAALIREPKVWLPVLMIFSAMAGAVAGQAANRSRQLWLKLDWTRDEMARRVESALWRYNVPALAVLMLVFLALSVFAGFDLFEIGHGVALLLLGCAAFTYLGLMITRGLGWFETSLCILTMTALDLAAIVAMRDGSGIALELEALLLILVVVYRPLAISRWSGLDWMRCRPERNLKPRLSA